MTHERRRTGALGEAWAIRILKEIGYQIRARNYRCRYGEVDVVAEEEGTIVFVEVKARRSTRYGHPALAVTRAKQRRMIRASQHYLIANGLEDRIVRFDVVAMVREKGAWRTELFRNAFQVER